MKLIDGRLVASKEKERLKEEISSLEIIPGLAVVQVGDNPASTVYVNSKLKTCKELGIHSEKYLLESTVAEEELLKIINKLNNDSSIHGILVQLPLPKHINEARVMESITTEKDVDCFKAENIGKLLLSQEDGFKPCTPYGIIKLLDYYGISLDGKDIVIVGRSKIVGRPLIPLLLNRSATVTVCHSKTKGLSVKVLEADIIIVAIGMAKFIKKDMVKDGAIVIDVGINRQEDGKLCGDVDFFEVKEKAAYITPVPGGVGPMTIVSLMENTIISAKKATIDK